MTTTTVFVDDKPVYDLKVDDQFTITRDGVITYYMLAPSGVMVSSTVPFKDARWWDNPALHIIWSYTSWTTRVLDAWGISGPLRLFNRYWQREAC